MTSPATPHVLDRILTQCRDQKAAGRTPVVVFDLDHTLMDNGPRTVQILIEFAVAQGDTALEAALRAGPRHHLPYLLKDILAQVGEVRAEVVEAASKFWRERFFTDAPQQHDEPLGGALAFVRESYEAGATVVYLSGRDAPNMAVGCVESLRRHGFPIALAHTVLVLKPTFEMPDLEFKRDVVDFLGTLGTVVGAFDNEPGNCNMFRRMFPDALSVFVETTWAPNPPPLDEGIPTVPDFSRDAR
ncbi:MAG: haloacid dehalogenase-like hydrolase [Bradymonadia bacterium]|jgi:hypothetical protein